MAFLLASCPFPGLIPSRPAQGQLIIMNYESLLQQLKRHEGLKLKPYKCSEGYLTIGYGRNLETRGITAQEANEMLLNDVSEVEESLHSMGLLSDPSDVRRAVLVNMAFQMGVSGLLKFEKMLSAYLDGYYELAAKEMLDSKWAVQTPNRAKELADQMRTGEWQ